MRKGTAMAECDRGRPTHRLEAGAAFGARHSAGKPLCRLRQRPCKVQGRRNRNIGGSA
jgi:hypothetical protein